ncbi:MAG TPA: CHASE domain-containing protein [Pseudomonadota bacterium]|nr:CHASE domain-containing protein [Pseudomonadota bacterium]
MRDKHAEPRNPWNRDDGFADFAIRERGPDGRMRPASERPYYVPVYYSEPAPLSAAALGFDAASDPSRREMLDRAARNGIATVAPIILVQTAARGVLLTAPVYLRGALAGYTTAALQIDALVYPFPVELTQRIDTRDRARRGARCVRRATLMHAFTR